MVDISVLLADLADEHQALDVLLAELSDEDWARPTPAPGWTVAHQVAHLAFFEEALVKSVRDPVAFTAIKDEAARDSGFGDRAIAPLLELDPLILFQAWRSASRESRQVLAECEPPVRILWFGPSMSVASKITARMMETWAHGQDIADACGLLRPPSARLRHVADIAVRARPYSYVVRGLDVVDVPLNIELVGPGGEVWRFGDADAVDIVCGDAEEFCLVLTRRRHVDDTNLFVTPGAAREWLEIGQTFAGDPGSGRQPGQFAAGAKRLTNQSSLEMAGPEGYGLQTEGGSICRS